MKAFSLWLFKLCWRREIVNTWLDAQCSFYGDDYKDGFLSGVEYTLETLHLKEPK